MARRPDGALESDVLAVLWRADRAMTPAEVRTALGGELAYTTVMTVLGRLCDKGVLRRRPKGRAFAYRPVVSESELTAQRMSQALASAGDREKALSGFVDGLSQRDADLLRRVMRELDER